MNVLDIKDCCTGCSLCSAVCGSDAITMIADDKGFKYPVVDLSKCCDCGKCIRECVIKNYSDLMSNDNTCYAAMADDSVRQKSSSGGIFSLLAEQILIDGGVVCGAAFVGTQVRHIIIDKYADIDQLRTSKYVQSDISDVLDPLKEYAKYRKVYFCGTPCQVAAVKRYIGNSDNLFTSDIMCMGVPSQFMWDKYLSEEFPNEKIKRANFRNKKNGWTYKLNLKLETESNTYEINAEDSSYFSAFLCGYSLRSSCGKCIFAKKTRCGDVSLGDFWEIWTYKRSLDDRKGTSLIMVNTHKGQIMIDRIIDVLKSVEEVPFSVAVLGNQTLRRPSVFSPDRQNFMNDLNRRSLKENMDRLKNDCADFGIINYWWCNDHGAILTAFALQRFLTSCGYTSKLIKCWNGKYHSSEERIGGISEKFEKKYLMTTVKEYTSYDDLYSDEAKEAINKQFRCFISGSDQVFRAEWVPDSWFLMFADKSHKMAVAASFGTNHIIASDERLAAIKSIFESYDAISIREESGVKICKEIFEVNAELILDPVFYIKYDELIANSSVETDGNYILCYIRDNNKQINDAIDKLAQGKKKVFVDEELEVEDFVKLLSNAEYVITDSYHALCFSVIFNRNILCIVNEMRGADRYDSLKRLLSLPDQMFISQNDIANINSIYKTDYSIINSRVCELVKYSTQWIKKNIANIFDKED